MGSMERIQSFLIHHFLNGYQICFPCHLGECWKALLPTLSQPHGAPRHQSQIRCRAQRTDQNSAQKQCAIEKPFHPFTPFVWASNVIEFQLPADSIEKNRHDSAP